MYVGVHVQYPPLLSDFNETSASSTVCWKISNFMKIHPVGSALFHADGRTDGYDEAKSGYLASLRTRIKKGQITTVLEVDIRQLLSSDWSIFQVQPWTISNGTTERRAAAYRWGQQHAQMRLSYQDYGWGIVLIRRPLDISQSWDKNGSVILQIIPPFAPQALTSETFQPKAHSLPRAQRARLDFKRSAVNWCCWSSANCIIQGNSCSKSTSVDWKSSKRLASGLKQPGTFISQRVSTQTQDCGYRS